MPIRSLAVAAAGLECKARRQPSQVGNLLTIRTEAIWSNRLLGQTVSQLGTAPIGPLEWASLQSARHSDVSTVAELPVSCANCIARRVVSHNIVQDCPTGIISADLQN